MRKKEEDSDKECFPLSYCALLAFGVIVFSLVNPSRLISSTVNRKGHEADNEKSQGEFAFKQEITAGNSNSDEMDQSSEISKSDPPEWTKKYFLPNPGKLTKSCDLSTGRWLYDPSYPLSTPYFVVQDMYFHCKMRGRNDSDFMKMRWQPHGCDLPHFQGRDFFHRVRNRGVGFIGDSEALSQFKSLVALLVPSAGQSEISQGNASTFPHLPPTLHWAVHFHKYNLTVQYYRSNHLLHLARRLPRHPGKVKSVLHLDKVSEVWEKVVPTLDIAVFNTAHWMEDWGLKQKNDKSCPSEHPHWVDSLPPPDQRYFLAKKIISGSSYPVHFLDITRMSQARSDGHVAHWDSPQKMDCSHWCVPGVPDAWNEVMVATLLQLGEEPFN